MVDRGGYCPLYATSRPFLSYYKWGGKLEVCHFFQLWIIMCLKICDADQVTNSVFFLYKKILPKTTGRSNKTSTHPDYWTVSLSIFQSIYLYCKNPMILAVTKRAQLWKDLHIIFIYLSVCLSIYLSVCLSIYLFIYLPAYLPTYIPTYLFYLIRVKEMK